MKQITRRTVILITLVSLAVLAIVPQALAANYKIEGNANGLTIALPEGQGPDRQDTGNLNPGDEKVSRLKLTNTNSRDVQVWIRTNVTATRPGKNGGDLAEVMDLLIKNGNTVITNKSFDDANKDGFVLIGTMKPGEVIYLDFTVTLPGPETGNEYQGSSFDANWTFKTQSESGGGGGGGGGDRDPRNPDPDVPDEIIDEEPIPEGPTDPGQPGDTDTPDPEVIIEEEPVPGGLVKMPKTGEIPPVLFYGVGSLAVAMGVMVRKRKK